MKHCLVLLLAAVAISSAHAAEKLHQTGKIVDLQQKTTTRVLSQVDAPITKDEPYYKAAVQLNDMVYVGDHAPRHSADTLPREWNVSQAEVRLRMDKHCMFLTQPTGTELQFVIVKRIPVAPAQGILEPPSPKK